MGDKQGHEFHGNQYASVAEAAAAARAHIESGSPTWKNAGTPLGDVLRAAEEADWGKPELAKALRSVAQDDKYRDKYRQEISIRSSRGPVRDLRDPVPDIATPDIAYLSRENKMPAKISDVPEGGKGVYDQDKSLEPKSTGYAGQNFPRVHSALALNDAEYEKRATLQREARERDEKLAAKRFWRRGR